MGNTTSGDNVTNSALQIEHVATDSLHPDPANPRKISVGALTPAKFVTTVLGKEDSMSNVQLVKGVYEAFGRGDVPGVLAGFAPNIEWREAEGHPYQPTGDPWIGGEAITQNLFVRLATEWDGFTVTPKTFHDAGDTVVVEARYTGSFKGTGKSLDAQVCHVWKVRDGKVVSFQQYTDSAQWQDVVGA